MPSTRSAIMLALITMIATPKQMIVMPPGVLSPSLPSIGRSSKRFGATLAEATCVPSIEQADSCRTQFPAHSLVTVA